MRLRTSSHKRLQRVLSFIKKLYIFYIFPDAIAINIILSNRYNTDGGLLK